MVFCLCNELKPGGNSVGVRKHNFQLVDRAWHWIEWQPADDERLGIAHWISVKMTGRTVLFCSRIGGAPGCAVRKSARGVPSEGRDCDHQKGNEVPHGSLLFVRLDDGAANVVGVCTEPHRT